MPVKIQTDYHKYPIRIRQHLIERVRERTFTYAMGQELAAWLQTRPVAPDLNEAPAGWHKKFSSFMICGEGAYIKTLFTIYAPAMPRGQSVDLDHWEPRDASSSIAQ